MELIWTCHQGSHLHISGYVHSPTEERHWKTLELMGEQNVITIKGLEGGIDLSISRSSTIGQYKNQHGTRTVFHPKDYECSGKDVESMWVIDPLDGTTNFIHGFPYYAISIAYVEKGKTLHALIIDVPRQDEFTASFGRGAYLNNRRIRVSKAKDLSGTLLSNSSHDTDKGRVRHDNMSTFRSLYSNGLTIRRTGSAALDMANVAAGRLDGFWGSGLGMWDIAAGGLLVREAGGLVSDYFGNPDYLAGDNIICSTNKCFKPMLKSIKPFTSIVED